MNKRKVLLAASILLFSNASFAVESNATGDGGSPAPSAEAAKPAVNKAGAKVKKPAVPETAKDRENKKKCRGLGGTWQLGHCNVG